MTIDTPNLLRGVGGTVVHHRLMVDGVHGCPALFFPAAQHTFDAVAVKWFVLFLSSSRSTTGYNGRPLLMLGSSLRTSAY